jgi:hypothetical protein
VDVVLGERSLSALPFVPRPTKGVDGDVREPLRLPMRFDFTCVTSVLRVRPLVTLGLKTAANRLYYVA